MWISQRDKTRESTWKRARQRPYLAVVASLLEAVHPWMRVSSHSWLNVLRKECHVKHHDSLCAMCLSRACRKSQQLHCRLTQAGLQPSAPRQTQPWFRSAHERPWLQLSRYEASASAPGGGYVAGAPGHCCRRRRQGWTGWHRRCQKRYTKANQQRGVILKAPSCGKSGAGEWLCDLYLPTASLGQHHGHSGRQQTHVTHVWQH